MLVASFFLQILALVPLPVPFSLDQTSNARASNGAHPGPIVKSGESEGSKMNETISLQEMVALPLFVAAAISFAPYLLMAYKKKCLLVLPPPLEISRASLVTAPLGCYFWGLASMFLVNSYNPLFYSPAAILTPAIYAFPAIAYSFLSGLVGHIFFILITPDINLRCWALTSTVTLCVTLSFSIVLSPIFEVYVLSRL